MTPMELAALAYTLLCRAGGDWRIADARGRLALVLTPEAIHQAADRAPQVIDMFRKPDPLDEYEKERSKIM